MKAVRQDGHTIELEKDCNCVTHEGPHWLHADELWRQKNRKLLEIANDASIELMRRYSALSGHATEEEARLDEKARMMKRHGIAELICEAGPR